ncbi:MAG: lipase family protein [Cellvibrionaceae bacterium]
MKAKNLSGVCEKIDFKKIQWYAMRAKLAYTSADQIKKTLKGIKYIKSLDGIDVQYFVEMSPDNTQLVSVRGTDNFKNIKEDADFVKAKDERLDIYVHSGFDKDAMSVYKDLLPRLDKALPVLLTGHSLGAAIATLLMMYLHHDGFVINDSINFGQPKVTNKEGVAKYDFLPLLRIVDQDDLVPLVPPENLLDLRHGVYEHLGKELILLRDQYYVLLSEKRAEAVSITDFWKNIGKESITDHYMDNYLLSIKDKLNQATSVDYGERHQYDQ